MHEFERWHDVFVPGRVCLFGEHSDWAGNYRRINSQIKPGQVIITGTNQGIHARIKGHPEALLVRSTLPDGTRTEPVEIPMQQDALLEEAERGGFFSYAAGVAYYMRNFYHVRGLEIDNYRTDLPVKKGLSSSAAFSVLIARAFNKAYNLKLTVRAEMEAAYQGEILTPSRCGRMDQGCAFGQVPVLMTFDGELLKTSRLNVNRHICMLIASLDGQKDTIRILGDLNRAYPFPADDVQRGVHEYLGNVNTDLVHRAVPLIRNGDAEGLGHLMTEAQSLFDRYLIPACPSELTAPALHAALEDPVVQELTYGGKGVGSQGDGCVQFVARDAETRERLSTHLRAKGMECFNLDLKPPQRVRKAVIPAAGLGTRMFPASKAVKKELFPVVTPDGVAKPIILAIIEEAASAGIEEIALIVRAGDEEFFRNFFSEPISSDYYERLSESNRREYHRLQELGSRLTCITQEEQQGFGHAVYCARDWVGDEPFLLMLGDHLYVSDDEVSCARQLIDAFEREGASRSLIGAYVEKAGNIQHYGTLTGDWLDDDQHLLEVAEFAEKPSRDYADEHLVTRGLPPDTFLCVYGQYVLTPALFRHMGTLIDADVRDGGEFQLTSALELLRRDEGILSCRVSGRHYDTGLPHPYIETLASFAAARPPRDDN